MTDGFTSGPLRVDQPHPDLARALTDLLGRVTVAGGDTGFTATTELDVLSAFAQEIVEDVSARPKRRHLLIMGQERALAGVVVLRPEALPVRAHRAEIEWLLVDPEVRDQGFDVKLLEAAASHAQAIGVAQLHLSTSSGQGWETFCAEQGWSESGRWRGSLRLAEDDRRDQVWFTRDL